VRDTPDTALAVALLAAFLIGCGGDDPSPARHRDVTADDVPPGAADSAASSRSSTRALMRRVDFHMPHDIVLEIGHLRGEMKPTVPGRPVSFDDVESFALTIGTAEIAIGMDVLATLMNDWVFAFDDAPLRDFSFETEDGRLHMSGTLDKIVNIGFDIVADLTLMPSGELRARPVDMNVLGFIGGGFLDAIGLSLEDLVDTRDAVGVRVDGNDLYLDPLRILPSPRMTGTITEIRVEPGRLVQVFGDTAAARDPADGAPGRNFMRFEGGTLAFGKLTMADAILVVIDQDPADPLDFSIVDYALQLVAGYSRTRKDLGLDVWMPDLDDVRRGAASAGPPRTDPPQ
jgi:hypothetical protein